MPTLTRLATPRPATAIIALLVAAAGATASAHGSTYAPASPHVVNAVIAAVPNHPASDAPFYAVFSTNAPLTKSKDDEGTPRYPGGVGIAGPAAMEIYPTAAPHAHHGKRWCYAAEASDHVWSTVKVGRSYPVLIALSNDKNAARFKQSRKVRTRTLQNAAAALGC